MTIFPVAGFLFSLTKKKIKQDLTFCKFILSFSRSQSTAHSKLNQGKQSPNINNLQYAIAKLPISVLQKESSRLDAYCASLAQLESCNANTD